MNSDPLKDTDDRIAKMKSHLAVISKLMETIQTNTNSIDDEMKRCEKIIDSTFEELSSVLQQRKDNLIRELHKTAKNKKLALLLRHNELNNKYQESQNTINKIDESEQNKQNKANKKNDIISDEEKKMIESLNKNVQKDMVSSSFDLRFNSGQNKQLIQMITHFGSISVNPIPVLLSLANNNQNFVTEVQWKLPWHSMPTIDIKKIQKLRIEWSDTKDLRWNHKDFILSLDDKKQNLKEKINTHLINVGNNGTFIFRIKHYYLNAWSKNSNTNSISITGISYDYWDNQWHGNNISVEGKCIVKKNINGYESAYLSNVASIESANIHHWRFKIEGGHKRGSTRIFGIWRVDDDDDDEHNRNDEEKSDTIINNNGTEIINKVFATYFTNEKLVNPNSDQSYGKPFGDKCHERDEIDMFLDLNKLKLFYKLNGTIYGKPIDIARANYRAVVSFYCTDDKIRLIGYSTK